MRIGPYTLDNPLFVAPMAGVTDRPFRTLCKQLGAGYAVSEMISARPELRDSLKTLRRLDHVGEPGPIAVQIAGTEPAQMADAARSNIDRGAQIIDINMGCPAKKVCNQWAGSALMQDPLRALAIIEAVVAACLPHAVPVTLKMRTGWCEAEKNALQLARAAEAAGVQMVVLHGRTRVQGYKGQAEHHTAAALKAALRIPVVANGDIDSPEQARAVLAATGCDAIMIGRAAQGRPWLFREIAHFLATGTHLPAPDATELNRLLRAHLLEHYQLYGEHSGVRSARKHLGWYARSLADSALQQAEFRQAVNRAETAAQQLRCVQAWFDLAPDRTPDR
ncbi:MAG: tRNA dihydrouridine synthase DusB, partial [Comamonadaceae bacterium]|nr:tRNA dihydrouridine synthase DusB [Comamonadaceae bacterium]